mmetsp:Transcript_20703/g.58196  ORF Transcript_20703/g.58196 Transcript_20703/m.58196 type:complete len:247 (-) Transcript_20703:2475-3215(-)
MVPAPSASKANKRAVSSSESSTVSDDAFFSGGSVGTASMASAGRSEGTSASTDASPGVSVGTPSPAATSAEGSPASAGTSMGTSPFAPARASATPAGASAAPALSSPASHLSASSVRALMPCPGAGSTGFSEACSTSMAPSPATMPFASSLGTCDAASALRSTSLLAPLKKAEKSRSLTDSAKTSASCTLRSRWLCLRTLSAAMRRRWNSASLLFEASSRKRRERFVARPSRASIRRTRRSSGLAS